MPKLFRSKVPFHSGLGNPRGNENPFLLTMGILWFRIHNHYARWIQSQHPTWDDELVFNRARQWTIALHQVPCIIFCVLCDNGVEDVKKSMFLKYRKSSLKTGYLCSWVLALPLTRDTNHQSILV